MLTFVAGISFTRCLPFAGTNSCMNPMFVDVLLRLVTPTLLGVSSFLGRSKSRSSLRRPQSREPQFPTELVTRYSARKLTKQVTSSPVRRRMLLLLG